MSIIGKNIKKIRAVKKISQADFANVFDLSRGSVGSYEEGRAEPKIDTIIKIANNFGLSVDLLLTKELTVNELYKFDIFKEEYAHDEMHQRVLQDKDSSRDDTPLVTKENYLEYIVNFQNKDYVNHLPFVKLPHTKHEKSRAFEVSDHAMEFNDKGLQPGDILSCSSTDVNDYRNVAINDVYVVVNRKGIFVRRLKKTGASMTFEADNPSFETHEMTQNDIIELWKVEGYYSTNLKPPSLVEERIALLEKKMLNLEIQVELFAKNK